MAIPKKPYRGRYPSAARFLMAQDVTSAPRQYDKELKWAEGIDIVYTLRNLTPANFEKYSDTLLLLAEQEGARYKEYLYRFAGFDVKLGRLKKGKDLPEIVTFQSSMSPDSDVMVWGPGYETPKREFLFQKAEDILDITKRYAERVSKQKPYKVIRLFISIRSPKREVPGE